MFALRRHATLRAPTYRTLRAPCEGVPCAQPVLRRSPPLSAIDTTGMVGFTPFRAAWYRF